MAGKERGFVSETVGFDLFKPPPPSYSYNLPAGLCLGYTYIRLLVLSGLVPSLRAFAPLHLRSEDPRGSEACVPGT